MNEDDRARIQQGAALALEWHATQRRKGSDTPYVSHLLQVSGLVLEHGGDADQAIAALLHDALEDAPTAEARSEREQVVREHFGDRVLGIVLDCTDTGPGESIDDKAPWTERKSRYVAHIATVNEHSALVAACDKLHNVGALVRDVRSQGTGVFEHFKSTPEEQLWFFDAVAGSLRGRIPERVSHELEERIRELRELL
jgi:(p)ppGpp synthase/HD superfamily hydrolase